MPVGRPRKSAAYHKLVGNYRPSRHAEPVGTSPEPAPERIEFEDLSPDAQDWSFFLETGFALTCQQGGRNQGQAKRVARAKWREHGPALIKYWGRKRTLESYAYKRYGEP
jgi:hypothetical protein